LPLCAAVCDIKPYFRLVAAITFAQHYTNVICSSVVVSVEYFGLLG
jgi:hypothetical protein